MMDSFYRQRFDSIMNEMDHDAKNKGLDEKALRARLRFYRRQIIDVVKGKKND